MGHVLTKSEMVVLAKRRIRKTNALKMKYTRLISPATAS